jgi:hypothetical protein
MKSKLICYIAIALATIAPRGYGQAANRTAGPLSAGRLIKVDKPDKPDKISMPEPPLPVVLAIDLSFIAGLAFVLNRRSSAQYRRQACGSASQKSE